MTTFDDRENAYEQKFAHDEEVAFRINARRNLLLGRWVSEKLGLQSAKAEAYAKEIMLSDVEHHSDDDIVRRLHSDLEKAGAAVSDKEIREQMHRLRGVARDQIKSGS